MNALRILSFNIHGGVDRKGLGNLRRIHALMEDFDIDIGVLQEMETRPSRGGHPGDVEILCGNERPHRLLGPAMKEDGGWYGNLILSRFPIVRGLVHDLERKHQVLEPRNAVDALIETPKGRLRVIGTHLSLSSILRRWEITNLIRLINMVEDKARSPVFFMGDFNEWLWSSRLLRHLDRLMRPLPCAKTFPAFCPVFRLDRVWCDEPGYKAGMKMKLDAEARTLNGPEVRDLSDHLPLLIEVRL